MKWFLYLCLSVHAWVMAQEPTQLSIEVQGTSKITKEGVQQAEGYVKVTIPGQLLLTADSLSHDPKSQTIEASGNVKVDYTTSIGLIEVTAATIKYDIEKGSGFLEDVQVQFGNEFYFSGKLLEVYNGGESFYIEEGTATACNQPTPQWSFRIHSAKVKREGYAVLKHASLRVKKLPVLYLPYLVLPAMQERRSGFLTPETGSSERNGRFFSQPYYWAPRQDFDATFTPTYFDTSGAGLDVETRYRPSWNTYNHFQGVYYSDKVLRDATVKPQEDGEDLNDQRYRLSMQHHQAIWQGDFTVAMEAGSDFSVDRDFLENAAKTRLRDYYFRARFDRDFKRDHLALAIDRLDRILATDEEVIRLTNLPRVRYYQPNRDIGGGFYYRNQGYFDYYNLEDVGANSRDDSVMRVGMDGTVSRPFYFNSFIHPRVGLDYMGAYYRSDDAPEGLAKDGFKSTAALFAEAQGPRLQNRYKFGDNQLVHYIDMGLRLSYAEQERDPFLESIDLDELDIRLNASNDGLQSEWRFNSRFFWRDDNGIKPILEILMRQQVDLESGNTPNQPIETRFRFSNLAGLYANGLMEYNPETNQVDELAFYASVNRESYWTGYVGYVRKRRSLTDSAQDSLIAISQLNLPRWRSRFKISLDYDFELSELKSQEILYGYQGQCVGLILNYVSSPFDSTSNNDRDFFQFTLSLRNLSELGTKF